MKKHIRSEKSSECLQTLTDATADRFGNGGPKVTTPHQDRFMRLQHLRDGFSSARNTANETPETLSPRTDQILCWGVSPPWHQAVSCCSGNTS